MLYHKDAWRYNYLSDAALRMVPPYCRTQPDVMERVAEMATERGYSGAMGPNEEVFGIPALQELVPYNEFIEWTKEKSA